MTITRISITLPRDLARAIDARAKELDRSRSWVIAEAARRFLGITYPTTAAAPKVVRESTPALATREVAAARQRHLRTEAALSPEERLRRAEELVRLARQFQPRKPRQQVIGFDSYEEYYEWKRARRVGA